MHRRTMLPVVGTLLAVGLASVVLASSATAAQENAVRGVNSFQRLGGYDLHHLTLKASKLSAKRVGSTVQLQLKNASPRVIATVDGAKNNFGFSGASTLPHYWNGTLGFQPTVKLRYTISGKTRTHVFRGGALPKWSPKTNTFTVQFNNTPQNAQVLARMKASKASNIQATIFRTPAGYGKFTPGSFDPGVKSSAKSETQTSSSTATNPYTPPAPNAPFTLPYTSVLGSGGQSWVNYLTGTGETTAACETFPAPSAPGGNISTGGGIFIYQNSSQVQQNLNIGGSIAYKAGRSSASLSGAYTGSSTQNSSSLYAVAIVNYQGGQVNLGAPTLTSSYSKQALGITGINGALSFMQQCGDSYPVSYNTGAAWISVLQIKTSSASEAQSLSANLKVTYGGGSAAANFSGDLSAQTSSTQIAETDECWGPSSCFMVPGYAASANSDQSAALAQFTANYTAMLTGIGATCNPTQSTSGCITAVNYKPISNIMPTTSTGGYMQEASYGVFGVQQNLNAWDSEYQSLATGNPGSSSVSSWNTAVTNLSDQGLACGLSNLSTNSACATRFTDCWQASENQYSYLDNACLPAAFTSNSLFNLANPFTIAGATEQDLVD